MTATKSIALLSDHLSAYKTLDDFPQPIRTDEFHKGVKAFSRFAAGKIKTIMNGIKRGNDLKIAINQAGAIATECGIGYLCEVKGVRLSDLMGQLKEGQMDKADLLLIARFANATWKAGQPFRGLERFQKENYIPAVKLSKVELEKFVIKIKAFAEFYYTELERRNALELDQNGQTIVMEDMLNDQEFVAKLGKFLKLQLGESSPQFQDLIPSPAEQMRLVEIEAKRAYLQFELDKVLGEMEDAISETDLKHLQWLGNKVIDGHMDQTRKDSDRAYFVHQIHLLKIMVEYFGVKDPLLAKVILAHDSREDQLSFYEALKTEIQKLVNETETEADNTEYGLFRIGVRMLTKYEDDPDSRRYLRQLKSPRDTINKPADGYYVNYTDEQIGLFQLGKVIDIIGNGIDGQSMDAAFHQKAFHKAMMYYNGFIKDSNYLPVQHRQRFERFLVIFQKFVAAENR